MPADRAANRPTSRLPAPPRPRRPGPRGLPALLLVLPLVWAAPTSAQGPRDVPVEEPPTPVAHVAPVDGSIRVDGRLDEEAWQAASPVSGFVQGEPIEGIPAEHDTEVRVLLGEDALYVGARMWDDAPGTIGDQLVRRDERGQFDYFQVALDPNLDRRTGYLFQISAANVQRDVYLYDDEQEDEAWDAVWASETARDGRGWTAELRIPLSQIRYEADDSAQTWGVNFVRRRLRNNERSYFALQSRLQRGKVSQFGRLRGLRTAEVGRRMEVRPYALASALRTPGDPADPFSDGSELAGRAGVELRYGLGAAFTLDATLNPDFGQVEADPAVINLSAFETFYDERRPFFVEDARIFDFELSGGRNSLFYSRRIGRPPTGEAPEDAEYTDIPAAATILGAAKVTGRTRGGLSVGALAAVTQAEDGRALLDGEIREFPVEPRAQYGVVRLQQDLNGGASQVGGIVTGLRRDLPGDAGFDALTSTAVNGGVDFEHQWSDREWALWGFLAGSHVRGSPEALIRIQRSSNHYFQRPDDRWTELDSTRTSLTGAEWRLQLERRSGRHWTGAVWAAQVTPGFEINDLGFSGSRERLDGGVRIGYRELEPGDLFRSYRFNFWTFQNWSHEALRAPGSWNAWGDAHTSGAFSTSADLELLNYWNLNLDLRYGPETMSRTATRGGPVMVDPSSLGTGFRLHTDRRRAVSVGANFDWSRSGRDAGSSRRLGLNVTIRPSPRVEVRVEPELSRERTAAQYVTTSDALAYDPTFGSRYVFADLERRSVSMETRVDVAFTPRLTLQMFAQPLLSSGDYLRYKQLRASGTFDFDVLEAGATVEGESPSCVGGRICRDADGEQWVDFDGDGTVDDAFDDRDFNVRSLIGNAVLRWEYRPGSTIFLVWQHQRRERLDVGDFDFSRDLGELRSAPADDLFIVKVNYWLGF